MFCQGVNNYAAGRCSSDVRARPHDYRFGRLGTEALKIHSACTTRHIGGDFSRASTEHTLAVQSLHHHSSTTSTRLPFASGGHEAQHSGFITSTHTCSEPQHRNSSSRRPAVVAHAAEHTTGSSSRDVQAAQRTCVVGIDFGTWGSGYMYSMDGGKTIRQVVEVFP